MSEEKIGKIYAAIADAIADVEPVLKTGTGQHRAQTIDNICNGLHGILKEHRIFAVPCCLDKHVEQIRSGDKNPIHAVLTMQYRFYADDGSYVELVMVGEGLDYSDKACNKAMTAAMKYALKQLFLLPTEDDSDKHQDPTGEPSSSRANDFLEQKAATREAESLRPDIVFFRAQVEALAARDLNAWQLTEENYRSAWNDVVNIVPGANDGNAVGEWLRDHGELKTIEDTSGTILGITAARIKQSEELPGMDT